jgi:hypothetical protein
MAIEPFEATYYTVNQIFKALSTDSQGNLIFRDELIPNGVTLSELLESTIVGSKVKKKTFLINADNWSEVTYQFPGEEEETEAFEYIINHNLDLTDKFSFVVSAFEVSTGRKIEMQEVVALTVNSVRVIYIEPIQISITFVG